MFKLKHSSLVFFSGFLWFIMGLWLFTKGIYYLVESTQTLLMLEKTALLKNFTGNLELAQEIAIIFLTVALFIGFLKARYILSKTASRLIQNVLSSPNPTNLSAAFNKKYLILIAVMASLGMALNLTGMPYDIRGFIDTAIGASLTNGALIFFKAFLKIRQDENEKLNFQS